jgi:hypothetical protein
VECCSAAVQSSCIWLNTCTCSCNPGQRCSQVW